MALRQLIGAGVVLASCVHLAGCGPLEQLEGFYPAGFTAPLPHIRRHRPHVLARALTPVSEPAIAVAPDTELTICNRLLYLKSASSPEELRDRELKCRAIILSQPY